jgi:hypothetical protein
MIPCPVNVKINLDQAGDSDNGVLVKEESNGILPSYLPPSPYYSLMITRSQRVECRGKRKGNTREQ